jgi:rfaE bifunctional protein nucleotidyltransferase chain/domain
MIVKINDLQVLRKKLKNKRIVFAGGVFDVFHPTHVKTFKNLRTYGDVVVIGIVSDKRVRGRKGPSRPILNQKERQEIVDAIRYVDYVVIMPDPTNKTPHPTIPVLEKLHPDIFVTVDSGWKKYKKEITDMGIELKLVKRIHPTSSTSIIERIVTSTNK